MEQRTLALSFTQQLGELARNMGYRRLITYILKSETGTSLAAAGWKALYETPGKSWSVPSRPRVDKHPLQIKILYEAPQ